MATVTTNNQYYTDIANAIRGKNGTETQYKPSEMAAAIQAISGGGEPEPPDDGKTRLYITVPANAMEGLPPPRNQVPLYIQQTVANGVTIDWGDGTAPETLSGTGYVNTTHTYEQAGDYVISLDPAEGCELGFGKLDLESMEIYNVFGLVNANLKLTGDSIYQFMIYKIIVGKNVSQIQAMAFANLYSLRNIKLSDDVQVISANSFTQCVNLKNISLSKNLKTIEQGAFFYCTGLNFIEIPTYMSTIYDSTFYSNVSISQFIIPENIKHIEDSAFGECICVKEYHFLSVAPPSLGGANVFFRIPSDCIIYVPKGSAEAYKTATNWTIVADHIQEEPA